MRSIEESLTDPDVWDKRETDEAFHLDHDRVTERLERLRSWPVLSGAIVLG